MNDNLDLLKKLRDITGAGMLDCKKYLEIASGNIDEAIKLMRSEQGVVADKKSLLMCGIAGVIMSVSWYAFTWAITHGEVLAASLGYFINPNI